MNYSTDAEVPEIVEVRQRPDVPIPSRFYRIFRVYLNLCDLVKGAHKTIVIDTAEVAAWERPIIKMVTPKGSRPGDYIVAKKAWTAEDDWKGADVVLCLALKQSPNFVLHGNDVYIAYKVETKMDRFVKAVTVEFPTGRIERVEVKEVVQDRLVLFYKGDGLPLRDDVEKRGNFRVFIDCEPKQSRLSAVMGSLSISTSGRRRAGR